MAGKIPIVILDMLNEADTDAAVLPATILYNEEWMLRLVLSFGAKGIRCLPFSFLPGSKWFSEALLYSPFLRRRGDKSAEAHTHADGVAGHFRFTSGTKRGLELLPDSKQFVATEAKMYSALAGGTRKASFYDQAARTVACMATTIERSRKSVDDLESVGFYVLAPKDQIKQDIFTEQMTRKNITDKVQRRMLAYQEDRERFSELQTWYETVFDPLVKLIDLRCWSWENAVDAIIAAKPAEESTIRDFYRRCLKYNQKAQPT